MTYQVCFVDNVDEPIKTFATYSDAVSYKHYLENIAIVEFPENVGKYCVTVENDLIKYC